MHFFSFHFLGAVVDNWHFSNKIGSLSILTISIAETSEILSGYREWKEGAHPFRQSRTFKTEAIQLRVCNELPEAGLSSPLAAWNCFGDCFLV